MKIHRIIVTAARTVNDPFERFENIRPEITIEAEPAEGEDWRVCVEDLQAVAEGMLNDHLEHMVVARTAIANNERLTLVQKRILDFASVIRTDQKALKKEREPILRKLRKEGL